MSRNPLSRNFESSESDIRVVTRWPSIGCLSICKKYYLVQQQIVAEITPNTVVGNNMMSRDKALFSVKIAKIDPWSLFFLSRKSISL